MFICFEGIDGAGKSTQAQMLTQRLLNAGIDAELVADPGTTSIGTAIRQILLHNDAPISPAAQMLLFSAGRAELAAYINERLKQNAVIICDRWLLSTFVYQGEINNISLDLISNIFKETSAVYPDICILLDISPEEAKERMGKPGDRYERRCLEDRQRMRDAYLRHATERPHAKTLHILAANLSPKETHEDVHRLVFPVLAKQLKRDMPHGSASQSQPGRAKASA
jgi:dTMP kinase